MIEPSFLALFSPLLIAQKDRATKTKTKTTEKAGRLNDSFIAFAWLVVRHLLSSPLLSSPLLYRLLAVRGSSAAKQVPYLFYHLSLSMLVVPILLLVQRPLHAASSNASTIVVCWQAGRRA
mmetsp:Transcript_33306/g.54020  ORF Transcript_33306/g.54020 Transcript_33306/m.54020 type:complete len:121 (+) Transcript_33306:243-605(+)